MKGISAVIATLLLLVITLGLVGLAYGYISGIFTRATMTLSVIATPDCAAGTATVRIRNDDTSRSISAVSQIFRVVNSDCTAPATAAIAAGGTTTYTFTNCGVGRAHSWKLDGPSNTIDVTFWCG